MSNIKILLTGATGFLGGNILKSLNNRKYNVVILKRSFSKIDNLLALTGNLKFYNIDEMSIGCIFDIEKKIDIVVHCATNYGRNREQPSDILESNLLFPLRVLETAARNGTKLFINTDTSLSKLDKVQGYMQNYIVSKKQFLEWGKLYSEAKSISFVNLVFEHIYGPGDDSSKFIAFLIESFRNEVESIDLTAGEQYRDFIYVEDAVEAYFTVIKKADELLWYNEFEVGSGNEIKIKELVKLTKELMGSKTVLNFGAKEYRENEVMASKANITPLLKLGWKPKFDIQTGLSKYIKSFRVT